MKNRLLSVVVLFIFFLLTQKSFSAPPVTAIKEGATVLARTIGFEAAEKETAFFLYKSTDIVAITFMHYINEALRSPLMKEFLGKVNFKIPYIMLGSSDDFVRFLKTTGIDYSPATTPALQLFQITVNEFKNPFLFISNDSLTAISMKSPGNFLAVFSEFMIRLISGVR